MIDPLAEVVTLLQPSARFSKVVAAAAPWHVRRTGVNQPFYCVILEGTCTLTVDGQEPTVLEAGDFALVPAAPAFSMSSTPEATHGPETERAEIRPGEFRLGRQDDPPDVQLLVGHCAFESPDAALLVSLLPQVVHVRGQSRLTTLVKLVGDESRAQRPAREVILARLLEVLLIEALRSTAGNSASPGLVRGLADARLAAAIRRMHEQPSQPWTVVRLAREAALSRSAFFERFSRAVGVAPMEYLLAWRMALAKGMLRRKEAGIAEVAERVGYGSASTFSVAFHRHVGVPPSRYAQEAVAPQDPLPA